MRSVPLLAAALAELPEEEAEDILQRLHAADLIGGAEDTGEEKAKDKVEALLQAVAAAAPDETLRSEIEPVLAELQESGRMLQDAAHRIWAGKRDAEALTAGAGPGRTSRTWRWWPASWKSREGSDRVKPRHKPISKGLAVSDFSFNRE